MKNERFAKTLEVNGKSYMYYPVQGVEGAQTLPYSLTVLLENVLRNAATPQAAEDLASRIVEAGNAGTVGDEVEFSPARVLFQDFTGVPVFVDFAVMREACEALGGDPAKINPQIPCDLVIDHSVIADEAGCAQAMQKNMELEFQRNRERYSFLKWAQKSFENVRIVPPGQGICHQLNIEQFAHVAMTSDAASAADAAGAADVQDAAGVADVAGAASAADAADAAGTTSAAELPTVYFDTLVGTDSHTTTANGIGVLGWGVGGIEAEAAALGQPITSLVPKVVGVKLTGKLQDGVAAMDVALRFAQMLREKGVVGCFVECFGPGVDALSATQRACISNMTPEYGCTCTLFPVDDQTLSYLRLTGRSDEQVALVEAYAKAQGFWNDPTVERTYAEVLELDLVTVERTIAGPSRPHDRIPLAQAQERVQAICAERKLDMNKTVEITRMGQTYELGQDALAVAAVTSCTTATDPRMMLACGLLAQKAAEAGLTPKPWVKCILAPGSHAVDLLLKRAGLLDSLQQLGFYTCGFGCMSCIGNSGPMYPEVHEIAHEIELASVLSGNRNFEGRISPDVSQNFLASPATVVAYSLVGTMNVDLTTAELGKRADGTPVTLADIWPSNAEIEDLLAKYATKDLYEEGTKGLYEGDEEWQALEVAEGNTFAWDDASTYVRRAPYFDGMTREVPAPEQVKDARALAVLGDFITTDHISPAGAIAPDSPAAKYLEDHQVAPASFNTYGARRGNHEVMARGTFGNIKLQNKMAGGKKGGWTRNLETGEVEPLFDVAMSYEKTGTPLVVLAGKMYGSGSSRDWAAKGPMLLGVRAAFAESFERIHRSNLIGMGILPLQFKDGENAESLGLDGSERYTVEPVDFGKGLPDPAQVAVQATRADGTSVDFTAIVRVDTPTEGAYFQNGGILQYVLRQLA